MSISASSSPTVNPAATDDAVLRVNDVSKHFGDRVAVDGVSFHVGAGETYGLLGPNGAGKSTTINIIAGLLTRDRGTVTVAGTTIRPGSTAGKGDIGLVPQEVAVYPELTATENLQFFARLQGMRGRPLRARVTEVLELTGLADRAGDKTEEFSGGMKRRLNIGIGLLHRPRLLILDEPTVGVDPQSRNAILESIEELSGEGLAILYTTHYMEEAERLCDRIGIIDEGTLLREGSTSELKRLLGRDERLDITLDRVPAGLVDAVRRCDGVRDLTVDEDRLQVVVDSASRRLAGLVETLTGAGVEIGGIDVEHPDLEAVFLHLTGKELRE